MWELAPVEGPSRLHGETLTLRHNAFSSVHRATLITFNTLLEVKRLGPPVHAIHASRCLWSTWAWSVPVCVCLLKLSPAQINLTVLLKLCDFSELHILIMLNGRLGK